MRKALVALLVLVSVAGRADAGNYLPPPGDYSAQWVTNSVLLCRCWNGSYDASGWTLVGLDGSSRPLDVPGVTRDSVVLAGGAGPLLAVVAGSTLAAVAPDGSGFRPLAQDGVPVAWIENGGRIVYSVGSRLYSIGADGRAPVAYPVTVQGSPSADGSRFVYAREAADSSDSYVYVVSADGANRRRIGSGLAPVWSPDGRRVAWWMWTAGGAQLVVWTHETGKRAFFPALGVVSDESPVWSVSGRLVYVSGMLGLVAIDVDTGKWHVVRRVLSDPVPEPALSPDGEHLSYSNGGECRDRIGVYVANTDGSSSRRLTNSCTITGTDGPDVLHGDFSQVVLGLGGDDTLYADDTYYYFDGISLYGGPGDDKLWGGFARDSLYGGPGDDVLSGGGSADLLVGGPGHDHIDGGGGNDLIGARDGVRDWISCGTNLPNSGVRDHDVVYADKVDVVAKDCEIVHRR